MVFAEIHRGQTGLERCRIVRIRRIGILAKIFNSLVLCAHQLHEAGVLHRDITPSNILLSTVGSQVKIALIDVSFACPISGAKQVPTSSGPYTAPEQSAAAAAPVSDYYSIAATCYYLANKAGTAWRATSERGYHEGYSELMRRRARL